MAEIALRDTSEPARITFQGETSAVLSANEKVLIKAPAGETLLDASPGAGKQWTVSIIVQIQESDA